MNFTKHKKYEYPSANFRLAIVKVRIISSRVTNCPSGLGPDHQRYFIIEDCFFVWY